MGCRYPIRIIPLPSPMGLQILARFTRQISPHIHMKKGRGTQYVRREIYLTPAQSRFLDKHPREGSAKVREALFKVFKIK